MQHLTPESLRIRRRLADINQEDVAKALGLYQADISARERGVVKLTEAQLAAWSETLDGIEQTKRLVLASRTR